MKHFAIFFLTIIFFFSSAVKADPEIQLITTNEISFTHPVKSSREAAVKIISPTGGHGSGLYVEYKKHIGVLTAAHVVDEGSVYRITVNGEEVFGIVVWRAQNEDIAFLIVEPGLNRKPLRLTPAQNTEVGTRVSYSGYPASYDLLSVNGLISGYDNRGYILMQGFGWFGASGSGILNRTNKIVGIVTALPVEEFYGHPQVLETMILVTPLKEEHVNQIRAVLHMLE